MNAEDIVGALAYRNGKLHMEDVPVTQLAVHFGTPLYAYSATTLRTRYSTLERSVRHIAPRVLICYALKANANPTIGRVFAKLEAGADVVSGGELYLALRMGFPADRIVFAGVGKTKGELSEALEAGIRSFHVESRGEADMLAQLASQTGKTARFAVRVNPDVDAGTHKHITTGTRADKFGVSPEVALDIIRQSRHTPNLEPVGLHVHVGSQLSSVSPILEAVQRVLRVWDALASEGIALHELDIGGGLGIPYRPEDDPDRPDLLAAGLRALLKGRQLELILEPGRYLVGPAGALLTAVTYLKEESGSTRLAVVDAGMNDLIRPALYDAWHPLWPVVEEQLGTGDEIDIVGPVCESADVLARGRRLGAVQVGDILAIGQAGAYGFSMSSQYNGRPRAAEVMVEGSEVTLIRRRESYEDLWHD